MLYDHHQEQIIPLFFEKCSFFQGHHQQAKNLSQKFSIFFYVQRNAPSSVGSNPNITTGQNSNSPEPGLSNKTNFEPESKEPWNRRYIFTVTPNIENFPQKWDFQKILMNKERHFFDIWHKIGEFHKLHHEGYCHKYHLPRKNWSQLLLNYSLVMYFAFKVDDLFVLKQNFTTFYHIFLHFSSLRLCLHFCRNFTTPRA